VKILIYTHEFPPYHGGAGIYAYELADGLYKSGQDVYVLAPIYGKEDSFVDEDTGFEIIRKPFGWKTVRKNFLFFIRTLLKVRPDITMVVECDAQMQAARFRRIWPFPYIITVHGSEIWSYFDSRKGYFNLSPKETLRMKQFFLGARQLIAVCDSTKNLVLEYLPEAKEKTTVVHNGISLESFPVLNKTEIEKYRSTLELHGEKILLCVSRLAQTKGYEVLLAAFKKVLDVLPKTELLIVGEGSERNNLQILAGELHCNEKVRFIGKVPRREIHVYYNICDLFVLVSQQEAFPFVCLEANACGKAVVAGRTGGIPEMVENNVNGVLIDPNNPDKVAEIIVNLLQDDAHRNAMGQNGRELALNEFTNYDMAKKTLKIIQDVMEG